MMAPIDLAALPQPKPRRRRGTAPASAAGKAVIYLRVSTDEQAAAGANGGSLASQESACRALCRARGLDVAAVFADVSSGGNVDRPALRELRDAVKRGEAAIVVVYALDRLSRSQRDTLALLDEFEAAGAGLMASSQAFETTTPMGRAMLGMLAVFAELQRAEIAARTKRALAAKAARGEAVSRTPFGLRREGKGFGRCPGNWPTIERILRDRIEGETVAAIAAALNAEGVETPTGEGRWFPNTVARLARNPRILAAAQSYPATQAA
jgi:site-specific DNA recombinase